MDAAQKALRDAHARTIAPAQRLAAESLTLERRLSDLVNGAYGLTPAETALLWQNRPAADAGLKTDLKWADNTGRIVGNHLDWSTEPDRAIAAPNFSVAYPPPLPPPARVIGG